MSNKILIALAALSVVLIMIMPVSAAGIIYPYTDISDVALSAGTTLILTSNPNEVITLQGNGAYVYFDIASFTKGAYTTSTGSSGLGYYVTTPDARIEILRNGIPGAEIYGKTISSSEYLKIVVTPTNPDYWPYALSIKTSSGGTTTYFGNVNTAWGSATGLKKVGNTLVMETPVLKDAGIRSGSFDIAALYNRSAGFRSGIPDELLTGTYYSEQHANTPTTKPTSTKTPVITKTPTPTKTPVVTQTETPVKTQTEEPTTSVPKPEPTKSPVSSSVLIFGLAAGIAVALYRR